jgi:EmrB/QacA subfamily drug resistance transporter
VPGFNRGYPLVVLAISCLSLFIVGLDNTIVNIALPSMARGLHASVSGQQWIIDSYTMVLAGLLMSAGAAADRLGRRRVFQAGLALFTAGSALCSLAPDLRWLIAFRVLQAAGGSMLNPAAVSIISTTFTDAGKRAWAIGVWSGMFGVSMALGPVLGGILASTAGWRSVFWVNVPVGLLGIALTLMFVPESRDPAPRRPDPVAQVLVLVLLGSLIYAIIEGAQADWRSAQIRGLFVVAGVAFAVLMAWELHRNEPLIDPRLFRSLAFTGAVLSAVCLFVDLGAFLFLITTYLQDVLRFSALHAGLYMLPAAAAMAAGPLLGARMATWSGSARAPLVAGASALTLSTAAMSQLTRSPPTAYLIAAFAVFGAGHGMINGQITNTAVGGMPARQAGLASGIASTGRQIGQTLGVAVTGSLMAASMHGPMETKFVLASHSSWWVLAACGYVTLLLGFATTRKRPAYEAIAASAAHATAARAANPAWPPACASALDEMKP